MIHKATLALLALLAPGIAAAASSNLAKEYEQVRAIAQRDPKVRAAYEAADRRLAEKIVEIDPALRGYTPGHAAPAAQPKPAPAPKPEPKHKAEVFKRSHVVAKGETLAGIAAKYHVTAGELRAINEIKNADKLTPGQVLALPNNSHTPAAKKKESSWWQNLKNGL